VVFAVSDTGIGIAAEHLGRVFEEFAQVDSPLQRRVKGTGLGLPLSRRLARLLGGDVLVESEVGRGSVFSLVLPIVYVAERSPDDGFPRAEHGSDAEVSHV
jgi:signal transduction histidine kinase